MLAPSFLYAGLSSGEVVVFNTKYRKEGSKEKSSCKVVHKAHDGAAVKGGAVDRLFGIKGYVMAGYSEDRAVSVWNTTEVRAAHNDQSDPPATTGSNRAAQNVQPACKSSIIYAPLFNSRFARAGP